MKIAIALALGCLVASAQDKKIDFTQILLGMDGKPLNGETAVPKVTLGDIAVTALHSTIEEDKSLSGLDKFKMDELARKVYKAKAATLSVEDAALIKTRIGKVYGPLVIGATWRLLDPSIATEKPTTEKKTETK